MAPFPLNLHAGIAMLEPPRADSLEESAELHGPFTPQQRMNLQILAVTFSSISVASAVLSFYWFVQMRRSFRHHLIMLLIQSDMFKALWFLIYPIVIFTKGAQLNTSTFCQVNGFFISLGIEASDFAILMIAVHTCLYIFRPVAAAGEGGLYPYRRIAYVSWVVFPLLSASLAFVNGPDKGYSSQGTYCYLPVRPFWYRLALSWVPRYFIFLLIFGIYATIYFYVRYKFQDFSKGSQDESDLSRSEEQNSLRRLRRPKQQGLPTTPPLAYNGLIPDSRSNSFSESREPKPSISTLNSGLETHNGGSSRNSVNIALETASTAYMEPQMINHPDCLEASQGFACSGSSCKSAPSTDDDTVVSSPTTIESYEIQTIVKLDPQPPTEGLSPRPFSTASTLISKTNSFRPFFNRRLPSPPGSGNQRSVIEMISALRHPETTPTTMVSDPELVDADGQNLAVSELIKTREKIGKQLRFLFIYPLVYIAMWLVPFVSHFLQYNDKLALNPPYALSCASVIFVTLQCAVDCWLFSTRERPWRHMPNNQEGTFWGSFMFWRTVSRQTSPENRGKRGPGKSRAEQVAEARLAYKRREEEAETWKRNASERRRMRAKMESIGGVSQSERERHWWDTGLDGSFMSPVEEESEIIDDGEAEETSFDLQKQAQQKNETDSAAACDDTAQRDNG